MDILRIAFDISIMFLALIALIGSLIVAVVFGGLAYIIHRWGNLAVAAAYGTRVRAETLEPKTKNVIRRFVVGPAAKVQGLLQWLRTFVRQTLGAA